MKPIGIHDGNTRKRLCYLNNAYNISYNKNTASLWTAAFTLPKDDLKNKYCESMNYAELWDIDEAGKDKYIGLFRIMPARTAIGADGGTVTYELEHVLATLLDDIMIGWHEIGNLGVYTSAVINYVLTTQNVKRWTLGVCDYRHQFLYGWQDENLLSALFSIPKSFSEDDYRWEFDTRAYPWTLNLKKISSKAITDVRYRKNINGITKVVDPTNLTTRLYCYGYGESDNRLTIKKVNNNLPYIDSPNIVKYGLITRTWSDERFTHDTSLLQMGKTLLDAIDEPIISYEIDIATIRKAADLEAGDMVRIVDDDYDEYIRVIEVSKADVSGAPLVGKVVLANQEPDIAQSIADLANRQRIASTYSQGAESLFADSLYDNADASNPAELRFTIPDNAVHVNEIIFSARLTNFRAYSRATKGGGASVTTSSSGGSSQTTSGAGGNSVQSSDYAGGSQTTSGSGGGQQTTSGAGGESYTTSGSGGGQQTTSDSFLLDVQNLQNQVYNDDNGKNHNHGLPRSTNIHVNQPTYTRNADGAITNISFQTTAWTPSGAHTHGSHAHTITIPQHTHSISIPAHTHTINIPQHTHSITIPSHSHSVSIPTHTHSISIPAHTHTMSLPDHAHEIEYGIYKGSSASTMSVYIDNVLVGSYGSNVNNINLIQYMSKNANGEVIRGSHIIRITPNALTRVECAIQVRLFTNAHGAGQY